MKEKLAIGERLSVRRRAVVRGAGYSRFVGMMRFLLPGTAAVLVALVVAWPSLSRREEGLKLSFADIEAGTTTETIYLTNARYYGSDEKDQPFSLTAEEVFQEFPDSEEVRFTAPRADITLANGDRLGLEAEVGTLLRNSETLLLEGGVDIRSENGYRFSAPSAEIDLKASTARGNVPVEGEGPLGSLNADSFELDQANRTYRFEGRVRLVLNPKARS